MKYTYISILLFMLVIGIFATSALSSGPMVSAPGNPHNLSSANTGAKYYADPLNNPGGDQVCIFCHTPHSASAQGPLWNRPDTTQTFSRYTTTTLKILRIAAADYAFGAQPNGSSRLCLSCHDGATPLGGLLNKTIRMIGGNTIPVNDVNSFNPSNNKMKNGHHPVSFVYATGFNYQTQNGTIIGGLGSGLGGGGYTLPFNKAMADKVKLQDAKRDGRGWMQCTTCHDSHRNMGNNVTVFPATTRKVTPFWVYSGTTAVTSHDNVCTSCHASLVTPSPW